MVYNEANSFLAFFVPDGPAVSITRQIYVIDLMDFSLALVFLN